MKSVQHRMALAAGLVAAALVLAIWAVFPVGAAPGAQSNLPTPTPAPIEDAPYVLTVVGGEPLTQTFPGLEQDGITVGETTADHQYPRGIEFSLTAESENGPIQDVILFIEFLHGERTRVVAEWDSQREVWLAHPWDTGEGRPAWTNFKFFWRVRDASDVFIETEPVEMDYYDPTKTWFRSESDYLVLYWTGFGEDEADTIAQTMANAMASTHQRRVDGFGAALSYKPITVIYPDRDTLAEIYGSGVTNDRAAGFTSSELGMSVQILRDASLVRGNEECIWALQPEDWTMERRINTIYHVSTHEITHLWQYDVQAGPRGYLWVSEGQAEWFGYAPGEYDQRLRTLATLQDIPPLETDISSAMTQADGCYALAYDVGPSFLNFLMANYGGLETHRKVAELMRQDHSIYEAVEQVTGKPFLEIENEWRIYLGYRPLTVADIDPSAALEPLVDPLYDVGDVVTLPTTPPVSLIFEHPGPNQIAKGQCFAGMQVTIKRGGSLDGMDYYEVDCMGQIGWMGRDQLVSQ